jgi:hypothetical protein
MRENMTKKEDKEKSEMVGKVRLFNSRTSEALIITDDELVNYDPRLWQVVNW